MIVLIIVFGIVVYVLIGAVVGRAFHDLVDDDDEGAFWVGALWPLSIPVCALILLAMLVYDESAALFKWKKRT